MNSLESTLNVLGAPTTSRNYDSFLKEDEPIHDNSPAILAQSKLSVNTLPALAHLSRQVESILSKAHSQEEREDEIVNQLCNLQDGFPVLLARTKETMTSAKDAAIFLKRRAALEHDYASALIKLGQGAPSLTSLRGGTFKNAISNMEKMHGKIGELRLSFSRSISEMGDNIQVLYKNTERSRTQVCSSLVIE